MYYQLKPTGIGRDRFIELMMEHGFRIKRPRHGRRTTSPGKIIYSNLIRGLVVNQPGQVWQSDITYVETPAQLCYVVFLIDVYTKKIVGYEASTHMRASANVRALRRALSRHPAPLIHHSDRGSQYSSKEYLAILERAHTTPSMGLEARENAYAERINKTIKEEYLHYWKPKNLQQLKQQLKKAVHQYNHDRGHEHLKKMTPNAFENEWYNNPTFKKPVITIFDNSKYLKPVNRI